MRDLAFKTYLIGQSSKLANPHALKVYVNGSADKQPLDNDFWDLLQHPPSLGETERFVCAKYAASVFDRLPEPSLSRLAEVFSLHHTNGVHRRIMQHPNWELRIFPVSSVEVGYMETELIPTIRHHGHDLSAVARASVVLDHPHYKDRELKNDVPYDVFLAVWSKLQRPRLIDGNHRAIHQARQLAAGHGSASGLKIVVPSQAGAPPVVNGGS